MSGNVWDNTIVVSKTKLNQMNIISGTSAYLAGLSNVVNQVHLPQDTGSGYIAYNLFAWDGATDQNLSNPKHGHAGNTSGGDFQNIVFQNSKVMDTLRLYHYRPLIADWAITNDAGNTTAEDATTDPDSIKTTMAATLNNRSYAQYHNQKIDFAGPISLLVAVKFNTLVTSMSWNFGVNCELVGDVTDNNNKMGWEICTSVNGNYFIFAANGSTRVGTDTGVASDTTNERALKFYYTPASKIDWKVGPSTSGVKTTGVPSTGISSSRTQVMRNGQKTTAAAAKSFNWWGPRLVYLTGDTLN
ncbi:MAG TPA: hypothetical protein VL854_13030 [Nitrososphaeraceae archaeon]|nr:hypothetical protein [Nitrososphaeraceae archaeon]